MDTTSINRSTKTNPKIVEFLNPQIIYIPINDKEPFFKKGDYVYKGDIIVIDSNNFPIYSSVSGYVTEKIEKSNIKGEKQIFLIIENDFKEKIRNNFGCHKDIYNYTKNEFLALLYECGINELFKDNINIYDKNVKYLIINAVESEPYYFGNSAIINNYAEVLLECIDAILSINNIQYAVIAIREDNLKNKVELSKYIGSYPNVKIVTVPNNYCISYDKYLIKYLFKREIDIDKNGIVVNNLSTILSIYNALKCCQPITEKIISIVGDGIKKQVNVNVKIGSSLQEIIFNVTQYKKNKNLLFITNGGIIGESLKTDDIVVERNLRLILITENKYYKTLNCINCGMCSMKCPSKLFPSLIIKNIDNVEILSMLNPNKCIQCGLCSHICPSKIEVNEYIKIAKEKVNNYDF